MPTPTRRNRPHLGLRSRHRFHRRSGFAIVLILMLIFLMLMLVLIYLRTMRAYVVGHPQLIADADPVISQLENDIAGIIGQDGQIGGANAYEPYDYPWTCVRMNAPCQLNYPQMVSSPKGLGDPRVDDSWLAPTEPATLPDGTTEGWAQVSNLFGSFLAYNNANLSGIAPDPSTGMPVPADVPAGVTVLGLAGATVSGQGPTSPASKSLCAQFQNMPLTDPRLVDADGDGLPDSLWFYPKSNLQGGLRYVAAVRIVDLSSMVNLNTALGEAQFALPPDTLGGAGVPRKGEGPYEIDASPIVGAMPGNAMAFRKVYPQWTAAAYPAGSLVTNGGGTYRATTATTSVQAPPGAPWVAWSPVSDYDYWLAGAAFTGSCGQPYGDKPDNGTPVDTTNPGPPVTRKGLRYDLNDEVQLRDLSNQIYATSMSVPPVLGTHYPVLGLTAANPARPPVTALASLSGDLLARWRVTTISGAYDRAPGLPVKAATVNTGAIRPCDANASQAAEGRPFISNGLDNWFATGGGGTGVCSDVFGGVDSGNPACAYPYPVAFKQLVTASANQPLQYQQQLGGCFADALDTDNLLTGAWNWMGFDPKPVLTEVYMQNAYAITAAGSTCTYANTWDSRGAGARIGSYAFELANPYPVPVRLANLRFFMSNAVGNWWGAGNNRISQNLDTYVTAASGMAKDAQGQWVLKPGERVVFYRNGTDVAGTGYPFSGGGGKCDLAASGILPTASTGLYLVDLGTAGGLDLNSAYLDDKVVDFDLQAGSQYYSDAINHTWITYNRVVMPIPSGSSAGGHNTFTATGVPSAQQGATGNVVYAQVDARTFGVAEKLNLMQVRPMVHNGSSALPTDLGDFEVRVNFLPTNIWNYAAAGPYMFSGTHLNYETTAISALGQAAKVAFPGPNPSVASRQNIKDEPLFANHVGIPGDPAWPGTFPELTTVSSPLTQRNNANAAGGGPLRAAGTPRTLDLLRVPVLGPIYSANAAYRSTDPLLQSATWRNTLGDAYNYFLAQDTANLGLKGLCLRQDKMYFDPAQHPALAWNGSTNYNVGDEAASGNETYQAQVAGALPQPDPTPGTGNVGPGLSWGLSNGPFARASQFWQLSWAEVIASRIGVDSPKYKGNTGKNHADFKPGTINLNTASKAVLKCLSLPTGANTGAVADAIIANRSAPASGVNASGGARKGLVLASEAFGPILATNNTAGLWTTPPAGKTNFDILSWLPQQASCRSDVYCAYIVVQGYKADDFNKGPIDVRRVIALYARDTGGSAAKMLNAFVVPNR